MRTTSDRVPGGRATGAECGARVLVVSFRVASNGARVDVARRSLSTLTSPSAPRAPYCPPAMDADLINLVNKLQDTFSNLGEHPPAIAAVRCGEVSHGLMRVRASRR
jgi:hypothetical protein